MSFLHSHTMALGMTTAKWRTLPVTTVPVDELTPTQDVADDLWPQRRPMPAACDDPYPHVVQLGEVLYLEDGHHRWARSRRAAASSIEVRVLHVEDQGRGPTAMHPQPEG